MRAYLGCYWWLNPVVSKSQVLGHSSKCSIVWPSNISRCPIGWIVVCYPIPTYLWKYLKYSFFFHSRNKCCLSLIIKPFLKKKILTSNHAHRIMLMWYCVIILIWNWKLSMMVKYGCFVWICLTGKATKRYNLKVHKWLWVYGRHCRSEFCLYSSLSARQDWLLLSTVYLVAQKTLNS